MSQDPLADLPIRRAETWQGTVTRLPIWLTPADAPPRRPVGAVWVSRKARPAHIENKSDESEDPAHLAVRGLEKLALDADAAGYLPGAIEVADASLAEALRARLLPLGVRVDRVREVPIVDRLLSIMAEEAGGNPLPGMLSAPGVFEQEARSFHEAARAFYDAAPWRGLTDEDAIRVDAPAAPAGFGWAIVLGAAGQEFGLALFASRAEHERLLAGDPDAFDRCCNVFFGPIGELPLDDADWMLAHGIGGAGPEAWPWAAEMRGRSGPRRPSARLLAWADLVLRAVAATTDADLDRGRWTARVASRGHEVEVTLSLPDLLGEEAPRVAGLLPRFSREANERALAEIGRFAASQRFGSPEDLRHAVEGRFRGPIDDIPSTATTPLEKAQDICWRAWEARGRKVRLLAREALALSPDCADAHVLLARFAPAPEQRLDLLRRGVAAGERALGVERFAKDGSPFWSDVTTRPYMRALHGLVMELSDGTDEERREAIGLADRLLDLNPGDNQGVRYDLVQLALETGDDAHARKVLERFDDDRDAILEYARALLAFRTEGDTTGSRGALRRAFDANISAAELLAELDEPDVVSPPEYAPGSVEEAAIVYEYLGRAWEETLGAAAWVARTLENRARRTARPRKFRGKPSPLP